MKPFFISALLLLSLNSKAQLDSCNAFTHGNYVQVGVNWNGAYGSSVLPPSGYHYAKGPGGGIPNAPACDTATGLGLGFIADIDKDGWTTGSPAFYGDYFVPGFPQEGWSILSSGTQANAWNGPGTPHNPSSVCDPAITGGNVAYLTIGTRNIAVWEGIYDSIKIIQTTSVDTGHLYFTTHVKFKNLAHTARSNVYYMRTVDPDNDVILSGDYTTKNKIESQYPGAAPLISTWGLHYNKAYLGLGTLDTPAKAFIIKAGLMTSHRIDTIYNGLDTTVLYNDSSTSDVGIGLVFKVGDLPPADTSIISFAYVFSRAETDSALHSTAQGFPLDTIGHNTGVGTVNNNHSNISIYPNPAHNELTLSGLVVADQVSIYDMMGNRVAMRQVTSNGNYTFNTANLPQGMYIIRVLDNNGKVKANLPVQKL